MTTTTLTIVDGVKIVVPDSLNLLTPYVLQEQLDWFESEIKFLRRLLQPGQKVIDIGANYGTYTLSMAQKVGQTGCVWAFEPASSTAKFLAEGIAANGFTQVVLEQIALSSIKGTAQLSLNPNSELNALIKDKVPASASETVPLSTLDECMENYRWRDIEFMKIDAEGEEANILKGGGKFFAEESPLVMYEIIAGNGQNMELVQNFSAFGYESYRLVPGLDLLVPFDTKSPADRFLLNLFCCKRDRAKQLAAQGFLLDSATHPPISETERRKDILKKFNGLKSYDWRHTIARLPYGIQLAKPWEQKVATGSCAEIVEALSFYSLSQDPSQPSSERFDALEISFHLLKMLCERQPSYLHLASLARVAQEFGARSLALDALHQLINILFEKSEVELNEPFLPPGKRFDFIPPCDPIKNWILASALEESEQVGSFSSFFTGIDARKRLEYIRALGFGSAEMDRRLSLLQKRFGLPVS